MKKTVSLTCLLFFTLTLAGAWTMVEEAHGRRPGKERRHHRRFNCKRARAAIVRTGVVVKRAAVVIKKNTPGRALLLNSVRHQRIARRIIRRKGMCHRAFRHALRARHLARMALKKGRHKVNPEDNDIEEEKKLIADDDLAKLDEDVKDEVVKDVDELNKLLGGE